MNFLRYQNPVWNGYCADPFVLRAGDFYYCYATASSSGQRELGGRHFVLLRSKNLVDWEFLGGALDPAPGLEQAAHWAPEVAFSGGKYWMYYSAAGGDDSTHRLRLAVSDAPEGPFQDCGVLLFPGEGFTIDASPFCDPQTGKWYLYIAKDYLENFVGTGTAVSPLADDMKTILAPPIPVVVASADWQVFARNRTIYGQIFDAWHTVEGAHVVFRGGKYWCFFAAGNWQNETYGVGCAVADHPLGPWTTPLEGASVLRGNSEVIGPGHNSVVVGPDGQTDICIYHAWNAQGTQRQLCIDPIEWTPDGPHVSPTKSESELPIG